MQAEFSSPDEDQISFLKNLQCGVVVQMVGFLTFHYLNVSLKFAEDKFDRIVPK